MEEFYGSDNSYLNRKDLLLSREPINDFDRTMEIKEIMEAEKINSND